MCAIKQSLVGVDELKLVGREIAPAMKPLCLNHCVGPHHVEAFAIGVNGLAQEYRSLAVRSHNAAFAECQARRCQVVLKVDATHAPIRARHAPVSAAKSAHGSTTEAHKSLSWLQ